MTEPTRDAQGRTHASLEHTLHTYRKAWEDEKRKRAELEAEVASHTAYKLSLLDALGPGVDGRSVPDAIRALKAEVERLRARVEVLRGFATHKDWCLASARGVSDRHCNCELAAATREGTDGE